ncbi:CD166 antigen-like [Lampetra fluviatilis]
MELGITARIFILLALSSAVADAANIEIVMEELVEVVVGQQLVLPCSWSVATGRSNIDDPDLGWFIRDGTTRTRIYYKGGGIQKADNVINYLGRVSIKDEFTLVVDSALPIDSRPFTCQVSGGPDGLSEGRTKVFVYSELDVKISGTAEPVQLTGELTEIANCTVAHVFPRPTITWYKDDVLLNTSADVKISIASQKLDQGFFSVTSTLKYVPKKADRISSYHCVVDYKMPGQARSKSSEKIRITLHYPAEEVELIVASPPLGIKERDDVQLRCLADANPPAMIAFFQDGVPIEQDTRKNWLFIQKVGRDRTGSYSCVASGNVFVNGSEEQVLIAEKRLVVNYIDSLTTTLNPPEVVMVGRQFEATCTLAANPELQGIYSWKKNGNVFDYGMKISKVADYYDSGNLTCCFASINASDLQREVSSPITVHGKPMMALAKNEEVSVQPSEKSVVLACEALGYPLSIVRWTLPDGTQSTISQQVTVTGVISRVTINLSDKFPSKVTCKAKNQHGEAEKSFVLTQVKEDDSKTIIIIVVVCLIIAAAIAVVLGLYFTKKACFAKKGSKTINEPSSPGGNAESIPLRVDPAVWSFRQQWLQQEIAGLSLKSDG